jgi:hypothetical protein
LCGGPCVANLQVIVRSERQVRNMAHTHNFTKFANIKLTKFLVLVRP